MTHPLDGITAKIDRGVDHLEELDRQIDVYTASDEHGIVHDFDAEEDCWVASFRLGSDPPIGLGILVGEAIQQWRSALDHLAYQLAILRRSSASGPNFPIYPTKASWLEPTRKGSESARNRYRAAFLPDHFAIAEALQPFNQPVPADSGLDVLRRLSNIDKHQVIHVGYVIAKKFTARALDRDAGLEILGGGLPKGEVHDSTELLRYRTYSRSGKAKVDVRVELDLEIRYGPGLEFDTIRDLAVVVAEIVDVFAAAVPEFQPGP